MPSGQISIKNKIRQLKADALCLTRKTAQLDENVLQMFYNAFVGMATIKEVVLKHHKKEDGTFNIKYRLTHNRKITYINTNHFAGEKQLKKDFTVKDKFLLSVISTDIAKYRMKLLELDSLLIHFDVKELANRLTQQMKIL